MNINYIVNNIDSFLINRNVGLQNGDLINLQTSKILSTIKDAKILLNFNNEILILDDLNKPYFYLETEISDRLKEQFRINSYLYPLLGFYRKTPKRTYGIYNYLDNKILFETENALGRDLFNNYIFNVEKGFLKCNSVIEDKLLWRFNFLSISNNPHNDNYAKEADWTVKKIIGVLEDKLWLALNHHTIVALDIESGAILNQIHDIPSFKSEWLPSAIPLPEATVIDEKNKKLIGFMWEFYWEINASNGEITLLDLTEYFLLEKIRNDVQNYVLTEDTIYFASQFDSKIGGLDRASKNIVWQHQFAKDKEGREPRIIEIQGNNEILGALSSDKTLYVFEKE